MYNLLKAVANETVVILVGDVDQLPSVGAGNVLNDIQVLCPMQRGEKGAVNLNVVLQGALNFSQRQLVYSLVELCQIAIMTIL